MEIIFGEINRAAVFGDKGVGVSVFAAGIVELETGAARQPDGRDGLVVECRGELIETRKATSARGNQFINGDVKNAGSLAQTGLRSGKAILADYRKAPNPRNGKRRAELICPPFAVAANATGLLSLENLVARLCGRSSRLRIRLRDAEIAADGVLPDLVDDDFFGNVRA